MHSICHHTTAAALVCAFGISAAHAQNNSPGLFEEHTDVGSTKHAGSVAFDAARRAYTVTGGGANMWFTNDAFHFVWKKISGDVTLAADISFLGEGGEAHRKACLLV